MREWLVKAGLEKESENLDFLFYPSRYHAAYGSIFPMGDLCAMVSPALLGVNRGSLFFNFAGVFIYASCVHVCACMRAYSCVCVCLSVCEYANVCR